MGARRLRQDRAILYLQEYTVQILHYVWVQVTWTENADKRYKNYKILLRETWHPEKSRILLFVIRNNLTQAFEKRKEINCKTCSRYGIYIAHKRSTV